MKIRYGTRAEFAAERVNALTLACYSINQQSRRTKEEKAELKFAAIRTFLPYLIDAWQAELRSEDCLTEDRVEHAEQFWAEVQDCCEGRSKIWFHKAGSNEKKISVFFQSSYEMETLNCMMNNEFRASEAA